jgi:hypothetical protein
MLWIDAISEEAAADGIGAVFCGDLGNMAFSASGADWVRALVSAGRVAEAGREALAWGRQKPLSAALRGGALRFEPRWMRRARTRRGWREDPRAEWLSATALRTEHHSAVDLAAATPHLEVGSRVPDRVSMFAIRPVGAGQADLTAAIDAVWRVDRRDPTVDRRLLDVAMAQPEWVRRHRGVDRAVAREAMRDRLPPSILWRTRRGSQLPDWLDRMTDAREEIQTELNAVRDHPASRQTIDVERLTALVDAWPERTRAADFRTNYDYRLALWRALVVSRYVRWFEEHARQRRAVAV